jgi:uncharacterized protein YcfL
VIFYQLGYSNIIATNAYTAYRAQIGIDPFGTNLVFTPSNPSLSDPTNAGGRIELVANSVNLEGAAIRGESSVTIKTASLSGVGTAILDAPIINYDLVDSSPVLALTNIVPPSVNRINGKITAWSGKWLNTDTNGPVNLTYHVLILDASGLSSAQKVASPTLSIRSTNVILETILNASRTFTIDAPSVTFNSSNSLVLSSNFFPVLGITNFPSLRNITNAGNIYVPGEARFGNDRTSPLANVVNQGSNAFISATALNVRADSFINSGSIVARGGPLSVQATAAKLDQGLLQAASDVSLNGADYKIRGHNIQSAARLVFNVTQSLSDLGADASNTWRCAFGFRMDSRPTAAGNLLGTTIATAIPAFSTVQHTWAGVDKGPVKEGFTNNLALGRLILTADSTSRARFSGASAGSALYVDYFEFRGSATDPLSISNLMTIDTNLVIYFAAANLAVEKLDGQFGGRLRWIRSFVGPNSSADAVLPDGSSVKVNSALLSSAAVDSDADGIPNLYDSSPFDGVAIRPPGFFGTFPPTNSILSWESAAQTVYRIEFSPSVAGPWQLLRFYTNSGTMNATATIQDVLPTNGLPRFYRILYLP